MNERKYVMEVERLTVRFQGERLIHAVNGVDLALRRGEVLAVLGESGSGKSVTLKALMRLLPSSKTEIAGSIIIDGHSILSMSEQELRVLRGPLVAMIFQEPMLAFDPVFTIGQQITQTVRRHLKLGRSTARKRALTLLEMVKIPSAARRLDAYPHELSGGMRQRAMIALALSCNPRVLLADEPTTALDATVQIQILLLLRELQRELGMAMVFVTHDIGVAAEISDRIAVMYAGRFVETGSVRQLLRRPQHPYSRGLLSSTAQMAVRGEPLAIIRGAPPNLAALTPGCGFAPRCDFAEARCTAAVPAFAEVAPGQMARCIRLESHETTQENMPWRHHERKS